MLRRLNTSQPYLDSSKKRWYSFLIQLKGVAEHQNGGFEIVSRCRDVSVSNEMCKTFIVADMS
ncbi:hypothetical protein ACTQ6A_08740 [Lachnospiraceae bacterium LCP25S3_G4]